MLDYSGLNVVSWSALINTPNNTFWAKALERKWAHTEKEKKPLTPMGLEPTPFGQIPIALQTCKLSYKARWELVVGNWDCNLRHVLLIPFFQKETMWSRVTRKSRVLTPSQSKMAVTNHVHVQATSPCTWTTRDSGLMLNKDSRLNTGKYKSRVEQMKTYRLVLALPTQKYFNMIAIPF